MLCPAAHACGSAARAAVSKDYFNAATAVLLTAPPLGSFSYDPPGGGGLVANRLPVVVGVPFPYPIGCGRLPDARARCCCA